MIRPHRAGLVPLVRAVPLVALVALAGCRGVADRVTAAALATPGTLSLRGSCTRDCNRRFETGLQSERVRHVVSRRDCRSDAACRRDEDRRHVAVMRQLLQDRRRCKRSCYDEGTGGTDL